MRLRPPANLPFLLCCLLAAGAPAASAQPTPSVGTALSFDGSDDYVRTGQNVDLSGSFTIEFWALRDALNTGHDWVIGQGPRQANHGLHIGFRNNHKFTFAFYSNDLDTGVYSAPVDVGFWHHWAVTYDRTANIRHIYRDGVRVATMTTGGLYAGTGPLFIAALPDLITAGAPYFAGRLDELRVWNDVRTQEEIRAHMHGTLAGTEANLLAYYQFNEGTGTILTDAANGNNGTLNNMTNAAWVTSGALVGALDYGDAPDPFNGAGKYPTKLANDGARHFIPGAGATLYLGSTPPDGDTGDQQNADATADDATGDDEDGVTFPGGLGRGAVNTLTVHASAGGKLDAWIDYDRDGLFEADEHLGGGTSITVSAGNNQVSFAVPGTALLGNTAARFRLTTLGTLNPAGMAHDGEVEDYQATISPPYQSFTLPGTAGTGNNRGWRMMSLPVAGATRADLEDDFNFTTVSGHLLYTWDGLAWAAAATSTGLTQGRGFVLYVFDDATDEVTAAGRTLDVPGTMPTANVTTAGLLQSWRHVLLGNPFHLGFDLSGLDLAANGFQEAVQIWNPATATYHVVTAAPGAGDVVAAWQGFFAERTSVGAGATALTYPLASRQATAGSFVGKHGEASEASQAQLALELVVQGPDGAVIARDASAVLFFDERADTGWDRFDLSELASLSSPAAALWIDGMREGVPVAQAQASRPWTETEASVFRLTVAQEGLGGEQAALCWPSGQGLPESWRVELEDTRTGAVVDLRTTPCYPFRLPNAAPGKTSGASPLQMAQLFSPLRGEAGKGSSDAMNQGEEAGRFVVRVLPPGTTAEPVPSSTALVSVYPNPAAEAVQVHYRLSDGDADAMARVRVYDVLGRLVRERSLGTTARGEVVLPVADLAPGLYVVRLETARQVITRSFLVAR